MKLFAYIIDSFTSEDRVPIIGFLVFSGLMLFVWYNYLPSYGKRNLENIAILKKIESDVRWKISGGFDWIKPELKEGLISGDQVFTGDQSRATIEYLNKKIEIVLLPNSLVTIEEIDSKLTMNIESGAVEIKGEEPSSVFIKENGKVNEFNVEKGKLLQLEKNSITVDGLNFPKILSPAHGEVFNTEQIATVRLDKKFQGKLQISKGASFSKIIKEFSMDADIIDIASALDNGEYYLRLSKNLNYGAIRFFKVKNGYEIVPINPKINDVFEHSSNEAIAFEFLGGKLSDLELVLYKNDKILERKFLGTSPNLVIPKEGGKLSYEIHALKNRKVIFRTSKIPFELYSNPLEFLSMPKATYFKDDKITMSLNLPKGERFSYSLSNIFEGNRVNKKYTKISKDPKVMLEKLPLGQYTIAFNHETYPSRNDLVHSFNVSDFVATLGSKFSYGEEKIQVSDKANTVQILDWGKEFNISVNEVKLNETDILLSVLKNGTATPAKFIANGKISFTLDEPAEYCVNLKGKSTIDQSIYLPYSKCYLAIQKSPFTALTKAKDQILEVSDIESGDSYTLLVPRYQNVAYYRFNIYQDKLAQKLIYEGKSPNNRIEWISNRSGIFYFRYQLEDTKGRLSEMSPISKIVFPISPLSEW